jgi:hypothetical protein
LRKKKPFEVGQGAWFYIVPRSVAEKLITYLFGQIFLEKSHEQLPPYPPPSGRVEEGEQEAVQLLLRV